MKNFLIKNIRIIEPDTNTDIVSDILVQNGIITLIESNITPPEQVSVIDLSDKWLLPGLVDIHVHLREPGEEYKETIESGVKCAASGGFVAIACMPNTKPVNDSSSITRFIIDKSKNFKGAKVYPVAAITKSQKGEELTEFGDIKDAGAVAFSDDGKWLSDPFMMRSALEYARVLNALIISHAEDSRICPGGVMNEGETATILGLRAIPNATEDMAVFRDVCIAELTGARLHIAHISTKGSVDIIRNAKKKGINVTCEVAPHHFSLTEKNCLGYNTNAKMNPPLRTEQDRMAIIEGMKDGTIDAVATDHAPHSVLEKNLEFEKASNGIIGLPTAVALFLNLIREYSFSPSDMAKLMSKNPAKIINIPIRLIKKGEKANFTIIDPELEWEVTKENILSKSFNTPFLGKTLKGKALMTVVDGFLVYDYLNLSANS